MLNILIRKIKKTEVEDCIKLFHQTVHSINAKDYTAEQLNAWAPKVEPSFIDNYAYWQTLLKNMSYVAEYKNQIVGFGDLSYEGYLDRLFVHKDFQGCGIATAIVNKLFNEAIKHSIKEITTQASLTAKPFFEKMGFSVLNEKESVIRGKILKCFIMQKFLC